MDKRITEGELSSQARNDFDEIVLVRPKVLDGVLLWASPSPQLPQFINGNTPSPVIRGRRLFIEVQDPDDRATISRIKRHFSVA